VLALLALLTLVAKVIVEARQHAQMNAALAEAQETMHETARLAAAKEKT
jgi:hypothetical protein